MYTGRCGLLARYLHQPGCVTVQVDQPESEPEQAGTPAAAPAPAATAPVVDDDAMEGMDEDLLAALQMSMQVRSLLPGSWMSCFLPYWRTLTGFLSTSRIDIASSLN